MLWFSTASCNGEFLNYLTSCVDPGQPTYVSVNNLKLSTTTWSCKDRYPFLFMQSLSLEGILFSLKCVPSMTPAIPDSLRSSSNWFEISCWPWNQLDRMLQSALQTIWTKWYTVNVEIPNNTDISLKLELLGKYHKHIIICFSIMTGFFPLNLFSFEMIGPISWTISWKNGQLNRKCLWKSTSEKLWTITSKKSLTEGTCSLITDLVII